jgi:hypothetical protein
VSRLEGSSPWPPAEATEKSVVVAFRGVLERDGRDFALSFQAANLYRAVTLWVYDTSGLCYPLRHGAGEYGEVRADVRLRQRSQESALWLALNNLTFGLIPYWETHTWTLTTEFRTWEGKELGTFEKSQKMRTFAHLVLLPFYPFAPPPGVACGIIRDLNRATLNEARSKGILGNPGSR